MDKDLKSFFENYKLSSCKYNGFYKITPEWAEELFRKSKGNPRGRNENNPQGRMIQSVVDRYAEDMAAGKWVCNGEPIVISEDGVLQNGHHRLKACIKAGVPFVAYIIFNAPTTDTYDYGKVRNVKDELGLSTMSIQISNSLMRIVENADSFGVGVASDFAIKHRDILEKAEEIISTGKRSRAVAHKAMCGVVAAAMLKAGVMTEDELKMFFRVVNSGNTNGCPRHVGSATTLRSQLENIRGGGRSVQSVTLATTYYALRDFAKNKNVERKIGYRTNDAAAVMFVKEAFGKFQVVAA